MFVGLCDELPEDIVGSCGGFVVYPGLLCGLLHTPLTMLASVSMSVWDSLVSKIFK